MECNDLVGTTDMKITALESLESESPVLNKLLCPAQRKSSLAAWKVIAVDSTSLLLTFSNDHTGVPTTLKIDVQFRLAQSLVFQCHMAWWFKTEQLATPLKKEQLLIHKGVQDKHRVCMLFNRSWYYKWKHSLCLNCTTSNFVLYDPIQIRYSTT